MTAVKVYNTTDHDIVVNVRVGDPPALVQTTVPFARGMGDDRVAGVAEMEGEVWAEAKKNKVIAHILEVGDLSETEPKKASTAAAEPAPAKTSKSTDK